jgi:hypothetical protein
MDPNARLALIPRPVAIHSDWPGVSEGPPRRSRVRWTADVRTGLGVGPRSVVPSGPPWRLGVSKPPSPKEGSRMKLGVPPFSWTPERLACLGRAGGWCSCPSRGITVSRIRPPFVVTRSRWFTRAAARSGRHPATPRTRAVSTRASPSAQSHDAGNFRSLNHAITSRATSIRTRALPPLTTPFSVFEAMPVRTA